VRDWDIRRGRRDLERRLADTLRRSWRGGSGGRLSHDGVVGWVHVRALRLITRDACAEIGGLVVDEARRGHGIGTRLMAAAENVAGQGTRNLACARHIRDEATPSIVAGIRRSKTSLLFTKTLTREPDPVRHCTAFGVCLASIPHRRHLRVG